MTVLASDGLHLLVGDGGAPEVFNPLHGATITRFAINQRLNDNPAIGSDAWSVGVGTSERRAVIDCETLMTDEAPVVRLRSLALAGSVANFKLLLDTSETLSFAAFITGYKETITAGDTKKLSCRLESSAAITVA
jgi:hypothetical protein